MTKGSHSFAIEAYSAKLSGTHDNETMEGWWADSATEKDKAYLKEYLGVEEIKDVSWALLREAFKSVSQTSIVMMQVKYCSSPHIRCA